MELQLGHRGWQNHSPERIRKSRNDPPLSPAKGILLTPGTAANKRKTVSFGNFAPGKKDRVDLFTGQTIASASNGGFTTVPLAAGKLQGDQEPQPVLTKSIFESQLEASKRRIGKQVTSQEPVVDVRPEKNRGDPRASIASPENVREALPDTTADLNVPCSRSGKHWKGEYDQYHRKSNREMRRIIQHGQTIKSYAQKKDSEATSLHEKLTRELAKVATMEAKVSELAIELANVRSRGPQGDVDPAQLVTDLAKQTATAIRYKQKADRYKAAMEVHDVTEASPADNDDCVQITLNDIPKPPGEQVESREMIILHSELNNFRSAVTIAEDKAAKLESENMALKQRLARVKVEMQNYEQRRVAREERLARKQAKLFAAKEESEAKFEQLRLEHQQLRRMQHDGVDERVQDERSSVRRSEGFQEENRKPTAIQGEQDVPRNTEIAPSEGPPIKSLEERHAALAPRQRPDLHQERPDSISQKLGSPLAQKKSPTRDPEHLDNKKAREPKGTAGRTSQESGIDIWTYDTQAELVDDTLPSAETPKDSDFSLLRRSTHAALQEISQNSIFEQQLNDQLPSQYFETTIESSAPAPPPHKSAPSSAVRRMHCRRSSIASPRPSFLSIASSAQKPETQRLRPDSSNIWADRRSAIVSTSTRTSTMGSRKALPPDRAEAAKKRLEAKKGGQKTKVGPADGVRG